MMAHGPRTGEVRVQSMRDGAPLSRVCIIVSRGRERLWKQGNDLQLLAMVNAHCLRTMQIRGFTSDFSHKQSIVWTGHGFCDRTRLQRAAVVELPRSEM